MHIRGKSHGFIFSTILIFIAVVVVVPSAIPNLKENDVSANPPLDSDPSTQQPSSNLHLPRNPITHHIPAGVHVTVTHGWIITARAITSFLLPVQTVAAVLDSFYSKALMQLATNSFTNRPHPGRALELSIGSVHLAMRAVNPGAYLTWELCEIVVASLLHDAQMGFTGEFRSEWYHPESGILLYVSLGVLQRVGLGPVEEGF